MLLPIRAVAQEVVDEDEDEDVVAASNVKRVAFSTYTPEEFQLQKRFWPLSEDSLWMKTWWRRITLGASVGLNSTNNYSKSILNKPGFNGFLGYSITPIHQLRGQVGYYNLESTKGTVNAITGEIQYLANLTNMMYGYNPKRRFEVSTLLSLGARITDKLDRRVSPFATAGFDLQANLGPNVSLFAQPYVGYIKTQRDIYSPDMIAHNDPARYNLYYGVNVGMAARLIDGRMIYSAMPDYCRSYFFEASTGWSTHTNPIANPISTSLRYSGNVWNVAVGRWLDPYFGVRIGITSNDGYWNGKDVTADNTVSIRDKRVNFAGRAELMMNLTRMLSKSLLKQKDPVYEIDLSAGFQYGYSVAADGLTLGNKGTLKAWKSPFYGFTAGAQALYRVAPGSYIFMEPRYQYNLYSKDTDKLIGSSDQFAQLNVGARVYTATVQERAQNDYAFVPHWWVGLNMGGVKMMDANKKQDTGFGHFQPTFGYNIGYDYGPLATFRFQGEWQQLARTNNGYNTRYRKGDIRLMYMLPFTNLVRGYDSNYRFHTYIEAGPTVSMFLRHRSKPAADYDMWPNSTIEDRTGKFALGGMAGILMSYDITKNWDVFIEANGQINLLSPNSNGAYVPYATHRVNDIQYGLSVGSRYHIYPLGEKFHELHLDVPEWQKGWFIEGDYGWAMPLKGLSAISGSGSSYRIGFGRWFLPFLGARAGIHAQQYYPFSSEDKNGNGRYTSQILGDGEFDLLINPLNVLPQFRTQDRLLDLNLGGGVVYGHQANFKTPGTNRTMQLGLTAYAQALLRLAPGAQIYFEPRWQPIHYGKGGLLPVDAPRHRHQTLTFSVGARILRPEDDNLKQQLLDAEYGNGISSVFNPHWWLGAQFGGTKELHTTKILGDKRIGMQPTFSFNLGYDFTPLHTLRGELEYQRLRNIDNHPDKVSKSNAAELRLLYMLNLTNLWQGTRVAPRLSVFPEVGLSASISKTDVAPGAIAGAYVAYRLNNKWDAVSEAQFQLNASRHLIPNAALKSLYSNAQWNFSVGTRYHLEDHFLANNKALTPSWDKGWFIEGSYGWSFPFGTDGSAAHASGTAYRIALGRWLAPYLGVRALAYMQQHYGYAEQMSEGVTNYFSQVLGAGEIDVLTNPLNFSNKYLSQLDRKFDINLGAGVLYGRQFLGLKGTGRSAQLGFTALVQALYRVAPGAQIFVEPRFQVAHYGTNKFVPRTNTNDKGMFTLSLGARITRPEDDDVKARLEDIELGHGILNTFEPHWWAQLSFGGTKGYHINKYISESNPSFTPATGGSIGYDFTPLHTLRGQVEFAKYGVKHSPDGPILHERREDLRLLYMLNLTNLWQGTKGNPRLSVYPEAGIGMSFNTAKFTPAFVGGALISYRLSNHWDLTAESQIQYNLRRSMIPGTGPHRYQNNKWGLQVGTRYNIKHAALKDVDFSIPSWMKGWFMEGGYGWDLPVGTGEKASHLSGAAWDARFGHWFNRYFGARIGMMAAEGYWGESEKHGDYSTAKLYAQVGGRIEAMFSPLNMIQGRALGGDPKFDLNISAGIDFGSNMRAAYRVNKFKTGYIGFTASAQALFKVAQGMQIYFEPRFHSLGFNGYTMKSLTKKRERDGHFNLSVGARIMRYNKDSEEHTLTDSEEDFRRNLWVGVNLHGMKSFQVYHPFTKGGLGINPAFGLNVGYDLSALSTFRFQASFNTLSYINPASGTTPTLKASMPTFNTRLFYMFNMTNWWRGAKKANKINAYLEFGPSFACHMGGGYKDLTNSNKVELNKDIYTSKSSLGGVLGILVATKVSPKFDLTFESMGQLNINRGYIPSLRGNSILSNSIMEFGVGTRYHF